ncbi:hypothetical protein OFN12_32695, partial [Escherichia coli]|nr:hypothetical protein [Escherichia coli]
ASRVNAFEAAPNLNIFTYLLALSEEHILFIMATAKSSSTYISIGVVDSPVNLFIASGFVSSNE